MDFLRTCLDWLRDFYSAHAFLFNLVAFFVTVVLPVYLTWRNTRLLRKQERIQSRPINLVLATPSHRRKVLPCALLRAHLSRAELVGHLGMYAGKERFDPLHDVKLLPALERGVLQELMRGKQDQLTIPCTEQFYDLVVGNIAASERA